MTENSYAGAPSAVDSVATTTAARLDDIFHALVVAWNPAIFVEAGAFDASTSVSVVNGSPGCRVVAFEANPYIHARFKSSLLSSGVEYVHAAVTAAPGIADFSVIVASSSLEDDRYEGYNSLLERRGADWLGEVEYEKHSIRAVALDHHFAAEITGGGPRFAAWIDVEGASGALIAGAQRFLAGCAVVKIELEERAHWRGQVLAQDVTAAMARCDLTPVVRDESIGAQHNALFVHSTLTDSETLRRCLADAGALRPHDPRARTLAMRVSEPRTEESHDRA